MKIVGWRARCLTAFGYWLLQIWALTLRWQIEDRGDAVHVPPNERLIGLLWHNRLVFLPYVLRRFMPHRDGAALISPSEDGTLFAGLIERFGFEIVRGSSSRQGASALIKLGDVIAHGGDVMIIPDGPRGPAYRLGKGAIFLAQQTSAQILPMNFEYSSCWRLRTWDRLILPKPFARARVIFGPPQTIAATSSGEEFERERQRLQEAMMQLVETP